MSRTFDLYETERAVRRAAREYVEALLIAATERATALAFRALPALFTIRPACELTAALARRLTRRTHA